MATWKKVAISGSNISQFNNDSDYIIDGQSGVSLTGSFSGSFIGTTDLPDLTDGNGINDFTYDGSTTATVSVQSDVTTGGNVKPVSVTANGVGFDISTIDGAGLGLSAGELVVNVDNSSIEINSDILRVKAAGITNAMLVNDGFMLGTTDISLGATGSTVNGLTLTGAIASGSFSGSFQGDGSGLTGVVATSANSLTDGNGIADFTYNGSSPASVAVQVSGSTLEVGTNGVRVADSGITATQIATSVAGTGLAGGGGTALSIDLNELTLGLGLDVGGTATTLNLDLTEVIATDGANRVLTSDGDGTLTAEPNFTFDGATNVLTVTGNQTITGNLTVQGTASFQNTTELQVADRFVLFASGSTTAGDGGIIVQQGTQNIGELFAFDSGTTRWGLTGSFDASNTAYTPDAFMAVASIGAASDPTAIDSRYQAKGNLFIGLDGGIWIYS
jgi:hypothetical protein